MSSNKLCGFDPTREFFAVVSADGRLKIWNVSQKKLHHQFTQSSHLQVNYTALCWGPSDHPNGPIIALGTHVGDVFCWDIRKGTELFHWKVEGPAYPVLDLCFSKSGSLFVCGESPFILQRDIGSGSIIRKLKADKKLVTKITLNKEENCLISAGRSFLKLWDLSSGEMITKFSGHNGSVNGLELASGDEYLFSSALNQRILNMWSVRDSDANELIQTFSAPSGPTFICTFSETNKRGKKRKKNQTGEVTETEVPITSHLLAIHDKRVSVWQFSLTMQQNKPLSPNTIILMPKKDVEADGIEILSACFLDSSNLLLVRGSLVKPRFEKVAFKNKNEMIKRIQLEGSCLENTITSKDSMDESSGGKDRPIEVNVVNDHEVRMPARPRQQEPILASTSISIEEKLEQIEANRKARRTAGSKDVSKSAGDVTVTPSSDSVGVVLLQALQSGDDQLLETCLNVDDIKIVRKTVERLPNEYILKFLNNLIEKFQAKPNRASELIPWIQTIIMIHTAFLMTIPHLNTSAVGSLYRTVDARLDSHSKLLKLSGRLDLLLSQISYREVNYRENLHPMASFSVDDVQEASDDEGSAMEDSDSS